MIKEYNRTRRVAQEIQKNIAIILQREIMDPRINMVTVSNIDISYDLSYAKVFVTFLNSNTPKQIRVGIRVLQNATGFIRSLLFKSMYLRVIPELNFTYDNSLIEGIRMTNLINCAIKNNYLRHNIDEVKDCNIMVKY